MGSSIAKLIVLISLFLSACASVATPYQAGGRRNGGYSERLEFGTTYRVYYVSNKHTPEERVTLYLDYRCADD